MRKFIIAQSEKEFYTSNSGLALVGLCVNQLRSLLNFPRFTGEKVKARSRWNGDLPGSRKFSDVPVIMITARVEEIDRLIGLEMGADNYICKPFSPREVVARVKAVLSRTSPVQADKALAVGEIRLIQETHQVLVGEQELKLTPCEYNLLKTFLGRPNRVFSRNELINVAQGYEFEGYDRTIDSHIKNLRKKIAKHLPGQEIISTIYGTGYKMNAHSDE